MTPEQESEDDTNPDWLCGCGCGNGAGLGECAQYAYLPEDEENDD